ncbi:hypothetical protein M3182_07500 [Mesobacillus maritimus]|nr:hypothetical protein [Mesobacillus maritimus]MCM3585592.1 hypothetical protein [Mesobacillus maritimus]MCM3669064.1 hypothetical protein [Mesobacillus maritimus]
MDEMHLNADEKNILKGAEFDKIHKRVKNSPYFSSSTLRRIAFMEHGRKH